MPLWIETHINHGEPADRFMVSNTGTEVANMSLYRIEHFPAGKKSEVLSHVFHRPAEGHYTLVAKATAEIACRMAGT